MDNMYGRDMEQRLTPEGWPIRSGLELVEIGSAQVIQFYRPFFHNIDRTICMRPEQLIAVSHHTHKGHLVCINSEHQMAYVDHRAIPLLIQALQQISETFK
jgi:hypothetical protein